MWRRAVAAASWFVIAPAASGCSHSATPCPAEEAGADAAFDNDAGSEAAAAPACNAAGSWTLTEVGCACGDCTNGIGTTVGLLVPPQVAAEGGTFIDSDESTWSFDPTTCTATLGGDCDASDTIDFARDIVTCTWTCQSICPPCPATCKLQHQ
jgi:hypothetical protein